MQSPLTPKTNSSRRVVDLKPAYHGEIIKPVETIDITGTEALTLQDRRISTILWAEAHSPQAAVEGTEWTIALSELRGDRKSSERVEDSIERLMKTIVRFKASENRIERFALLGGSVIDYKQGTLTFSLDKRLTALLKNSKVFGKLERKVLMAFDSKYAFALYEHVARRVKLNSVFKEKKTLEEFRAILGVPEGKLKTFGNINQYAIKPAMLEINGLAPFSILIFPFKTGRKVTHVEIHWNMKEGEERKRAFREAHGSRVGRKARLTGTVEEMAELGESSG